MMGIVKGLQQQVGLQSSKKMAYYCYKGHYNGPNGLGLHVWIGKEKKIMMEEIDATRMNEDSGDAAAYPQTDFQVTW